MKDTMELTYGQLCDFFNEDKKNGKARDNQFSKWRKEYDIKKLNGVNKYTVTPLSIYQQTKLNGYIKYNETVEPMIYYLMSISENGQLICSTNKIGEMIGLINDTYIETRYSKELKQTISEMLGISVEELNKFQNEVDLINKRTIEKIINDMEKKELIIDNKCYHIQYINKDGEITEENTTDIETKRILEIQNIMSEKAYNKQFYQLGNFEKEVVYRMVRDYFGYTTYYKVHNLIIDKGAVKYCLNKKFNFDNNKELTNRKNHVRIMRSKQGSLKEIPIRNKEKIVDKLIDI